MFQILLRSSAAGSLDPSNLANEIAYSVLEYVRRYGEYCHKDEGISDPARKK